jgi:hypothetical protein
MTFRSKESLSNLAYCVIYYIIYQVFTKCETEMSSNVALAVVMVANLQITFLMDVINLDLLCVHIPGYTASQSKLRNQAIRVLFREANDWAKPIGTQTAFFRFYVVPFTFSNHVSWGQLEQDCDRFLSHPFQFIIYKIFHRTTRYNLDAICKLPSYCFYLTCESVPAVSGTTISSPLASSCSCDSSCS